MKDFEINERVVLPLESHYLREWKNYVRILSMYLDMKVDEIKNYNIYADFIL